MTRFYTVVFVLFVLFPTLLSAQTGKYDLRFELSHVDCENSKLYVEIQIKAHDEECSFRLSDQNYRFAFNNTLVYNSVSIEEELDVSGYIGSSTGYSFYQSHTLTGSLDSIVSYNIEFMNGEGLLIEADEWTNVGQLGFDIADGGGIVRLIYMDENMFPATFVGQYYNETRLPTAAGNFEALEINLGNYCSEFSSDQETVGIINSAIENSISLFPNLANNFINLRCGDNICGNWRIIDVRGQVIRHWQETQNTTSLNNLDISSFPSGAYFLQLNIDGYYLARRFVKI